MGLVEIIRNNDPAAMRAWIAEVGPKRDTAEHALPPTAPRSVVLVELAFQDLTAMHIAAYYDALECFLILHEAGSSLRIQSAKDFAPIHYAVLNSSWEVLSFILAKDKEQITWRVTQLSLFKIAIHAGDRKVLRILFGAGLDAGKPDHAALIEDAARLGRLDAVEEILARQRGPPASSGWTPLMRAIAGRQLEIAKLLLDYHYDVNARADGQSALSIACTWGDDWYDLIEGICAVAERRSIDAPQEEAPDGAVHWACGSKSLRIIKLVCDTLGVDVNRVDKHGHIGLARAIDKMDEAAIIDALQFLIERGLTFEGTRASFVVDLVNAVNPALTVVAWMIEQGLVDRDTQVSDAPMETQGKTVCLGEFLHRSRVGMALAQRYWPDYEPPTTRGKAGRGGRVPTGHEQGGMGGR